MFYASGGELHRQGGTTPVPRRTGAGKGAASSVSVIIGTAIETDGHRKTGLLC
ncbi:hypothetical protein [Christensenella minuta]|uniref:Uncharacterized protein n=1 Tax=Christensenella minuta TaxID=626937 RepID=A0A136Q5W6_9FIRM|nr:hypothetical protein [Christensenella minuta]KXK66032.1 hypothetical protein HMPREF3293_01104 [Christensenella minuta]